MALKILPLWFLLETHYIFSSRQTFVFRWKNMLSTELQEYGFQKKLMVNGKKRKECFCRSQARSDGCEFVQGDKMLFCTVREGYSGINWFSADFIDGKWTNWKNANFNPSYEVGELHIYGDELYYHSSRAGGKGELDIWMLRNILFILAFIADSF